MSSAFYYMSSISYRKQELFTIQEHLDSSQGFRGVSAAHQFSFLCCVFGLFVFVPCIVYPMLLVSFDNPFMIFLKVFANVYLRLCKLVR